MNGTKIMAAGLLGVALCLSGNAIAQQIGAEASAGQSIGGQGIGGVSAGAITFGVIAAAAITQTSDDAAVESSDLPDLPPEILQATLSELLDSPYVADLDIDRAAIPAAILDEKIADLWVDPTFVTVLQSVVGEEQVELLFDTLNNDSGHLVSDMLETIQVPTGTGS